MSTVVSEIERAPQPSLEVPPSDPQAPLRGGGPLLLAIFLLSGASGLVYQVVWSRELTLVFGSTTQGVATVLAAFMGGLALGSYIASRLGDRLARPLRAYGFLELGIAAASLSVLALMPALNFAYRAIYPFVHLSLPGLTLVRFALAAAFLLPATTLMGATLPILSAYFERRGGIEGQGASTLYAVNTVGAVLGAAGAGFWLLPAAGMRDTTILAAIGNVAAAAGAYAISRRTEIAAGAVRVPFTGRAPEVAGEIAVPALPLPSDALAAVAAALALSGAGALILEVAWTRTLSLVLGSSTHAFTVMLTTFLLGLAGGSAIASRLLGRIRNPLAALAFAELVVGLTTYLGTFIFPELPYAFLVLFRSAQGSPAWLQAGRFALAGAVMLAPTLMLGATFPLAIRCWRLGGEGTARPVGWLYAVNTLGAIVGSLAAGFLLVPFVGLRQTIVAGAVVNLTVGAFLIAVTPSYERGRRWALAGLVALLLPCLPFGAPPWNPVVMTSGVFQYAPTYVGEFPSRRAFLDYQNAHKQLYYRDGATTTVTVEKRPLTKGGRVWLVLTVNGKVDASSIGDMETQILLGQFPLLTARDPRRALVIGWGSGITAGSMLSLPTLESLHAVELEPAVIEASRFFREFNHDPYADPRLRIEINDARHALLVDDARYDVIVSEPSNPWLSGPSRLFTREFFVMAKQRLAPGGILCQWVQLYGLDPDAYRALLRTLSQVFEDIVVVKGSPGDTLVMASATPIRFDVAAISRRMSLPSVAADLARVKIDDPAGLLAKFRVGGAALRSFVGGGKINTDDNALIEFAALRNLYRTTDPENDALLSGAPSSPLDHADLGGLALADAALFPVKLADQLLRSGLQDRALQALDRTPAGAAATPGASAAATALRGDILSRQGKKDEARAAWVESLRIDPACLPAATSLGLLAEEIGRADAADLDRFQRTAAAAPRAAEAHVALARGLRAAGRNPDALREFESASKLDPPPGVAAFLHRSWGQACFADGDVECAERELTRYFREWTDVTKPLRSSVDAAVDLARADLRLGRRASALERMKVATDLASSVATWERDQAEAAMRRGDDGAAEAHLRSALEWSAQNASGYHELGDLLMRQRRWDDALAIWSELLLRYPDDYRGLAASVEALGQARRPAEAAPLIRRMIDLEEDPDRIAILRDQLQSVAAVP
jgi:spermidine synthase